MSFCFILFPILFWFWLTIYNWHKIPFPVFTMKKGEYENSVNQSTTDFSERKEETLVGARMGSLHDKVFGNQSVPNSVVSLHRSWRKD